MRELSGLSPTLIFEAYWGHNWSQRVSEAMRIMRTCTISAGWSEETASSIFGGRGSVLGSGLGQGVRIVKTFNLPQTATGLIRIGLEFAEHPPYIDMLVTRKLQIYTPTTVKARWRTYFSISATFPKYEFLICDYFTIASFFEMFLIEARIGGDVGWFQWCQMVSMHYLMRVDKFSAL